MPVYIWTEFNLLVTSQVSLKNQAQAKESLRAKQSNLMPLTLCIFNKIEEIASSPAAPRNDLKLDYILNLFLRHNTLSMKSHFEFKESNT